MALALLPSPTTVIPSKLDGLAFSFTEIFSTILLKKNRGELVSRLVFSIFDSLPIR